MGIGGPTFSSRVSPDRNSDQRRSVRINDSSTNSRLTWASIAQLVLGLFPQARRVPVRVDSGQPRRSQGSHMV
jgi:hypothetical protein